MTMVTQQALYHPINMGYTRAINSNIITSSGLGGTLLTTGEGTGLLGDGVLLSESSLAEPRLLLLATAHMCINLCCSSCSQ